MSVGTVIRERRHAAGLTLVELAARTELSQPFLSQVENDRARPSMGSLYRIARALDTTPQALFDDPAAVEAAVGVDSLVRVLLPGGAPVHLVEYDGLPTEFLDPWEHDGFEVAYVVSGEVETDLDGEVHRLRAGEVLAYEATTPHRHRSVGATPARLLLIETEREHHER